MNITDTLSKEYINHLHDAFELFDEDGDDYLESNMIESALRYVGLNPSIEEIRDILSDINCCPISFGAFLYIVFHHSRNSDVEDELCVALQVFDTDSTGFLPVDQIKKIMKSLKRPFTDRQLDDVLSRLRSRNGNVKYREFIQMLLRQ